MIKAVIFDAGGVIIDDQYLNEELLKVFQPGNKKSFLEMYKKEGKRLSLSKGKIPLFEFWQKLAKKLNKKIPCNILRDLWVKDYRKLASINKDVEKIILSLKNKYKLGIISNTVKEHAEVNKRRKIFKYFDMALFSNEVKLTKSEDEIFLLATRKLGVNPKECIFIDDNYKFVKRANQLDMKAIHFKNAKQLKLDLIRKGIRFSK